MKILLSFVFACMGPAIIAFAADAPVIDPGQFVYNFYQFALIIGGILAFGAIVYGGVKYGLAAGNPSGKSEGKEWVIQAILGLILLFGVYIILNTINPNLTNLTLPTLKGVQVTTTGGGGGGGGGGSSSSGCSNCQALGSSGFYCKSASSCTADPREIQMLQCVQNASHQALRITEAYPPDPTQAHNSQCHFNGCCVDLTPASGQTASCAEVQAIVNAAVSQCGGVLGHTVLNEWSSSCGGTQYNTTNHYNIHIQGC